MLKWRRIRIGLAMLSMAVLAGAQGGTAVGQSPSVAPSPLGPSPTPVIGACAWLAGLLPSTLQGLPLNYTVNVGEAAASPPELVMPLLATLGVGLEDVCQVNFGYGDQYTSGQILEFIGADPAVLPGAFTSFFVDVFAQFGTQLVATEGTIGGRPVTVLTPIESSGMSALTIYPLGDALFISGDSAVLEAVLPLLPAPGEPIPDVTAPPATAPPSAGSSASPAG